GYRLSIPRWRIGLSVLARRMPSNEIYGWLERLKVRRRDADAVAAAVTMAPRLAARLSSDDVQPAEVVALAEPAAPDAPLLALALADLPLLHRYFAELQGIRLEVTGTDLARLGLSESPRVGDVLAELRRRQLNGERAGRGCAAGAARGRLGAGGPGPARLRAGPHGGRPRCAGRRGHEVRVGRRHGCPCRSWNRDSGGKPPPGPPSETGPLCGRVSL